MSGLTASELMVAWKPRGSRTGLELTTAVMAEGLMSTTCAGEIGVSFCSQEAKSGRERDGG
jgi:hypothetical protein